MSIFDKLFSAGKAQANKAANGAIDADPVAVVQLEIDEATDEIQRAQPDLRDLKGHVNNLSRQSEEEARDIADLNGKIDLLVSAGSDASAAELDATLQEKETAHATTVASLTKFTASYNKVVANIKASRKRITDAQGHAQQVGLALKLSEANKHAAEISANLASVNNDKFSRIGHALEVAQQRIDSNNATAEVQMDLGIGGGNEEGTTSTVAADLAAAASKKRLADRRAKLGGGGINGGGVATIQSPATVTVTTTVVPQGV